MDDGFDPGAYVVRSVRESASGMSIYTLVDMGGRTFCVAVPRNLTLSEYLHLTLRAAVSNSRPRARA